MSINNMSTQHTLGGCRRRRVKIYQLIMSIYAEFKRELIICGQ